MNRLIPAAVAGVLILGGLVGCGDEPAPAGNAPAAEAADVPDCDADDKRKNEVPDCGFTYQGTFYAWSWVKDGRKTAPRGWDAEKERAAIAGRSKVGSRPTAVQRPSTAQQDTSKPVTPKKTRPSTRRSR